MRTYEHRARIIWPRDDSLVPIEDEELEEPDEGEQGEVLPVAEDTTRRISGRESARRANLPRDWVRRHWKEVDGPD